MNSLWCNHSSKFIHCFSYDTRTCVNIKYLSILDDTIESQSCRTRVKFNLIFFYTISLRSVHNRWCWINLFSQFGSVIREGVEFDPFYDAGRGRSVKSARLLLDRGSSQRSVAYTAKCLLSGVHGGYPPYFLPRLAQCGRNPQFSFYCGTTKRQTNVWIDFRHQCENRGVSHWRFRHPIRQISVCTIQLFDEWGR